MSQPEDPNATTVCPLCAGVTPILRESTYWRLVLNRNQNLLGKSMLVLRHHQEAVAALTAEEWLDLQTEIRRATAMLQRAFSPDHFNYAFLQNQDRHVHLHIIPRYAAQRIFAGQVFKDPDYPAHYAVPAPDRQLGPGLVNALTAYMRGRL